MVNGEYRISSNLICTWQKWQKNYSLFVRAQKVIFNEKAKKVAFLLFRQNCTANIESLNMRFKKKKKVHTARTSVHTNCFNSSIKNNIILPTGAPFIFNNAKRVKHRNIIHSYEHNFQKYNRMEIVRPVNST